jgi:hypothetical protein
VIRREARLTSYGLQDRMEDGVAMMNGMHDGESECSICVIRVSS